MLVVVTSKGSNTVWQVIDPSDGCIVLADNLPDAETAHQEREKLMEEERLAAEEDEKLAIVSP